MCVFLSTQLGEDAWEEEEEEEEERKGEGRSDVDQADENLSATPKVAVMSQILHSLELN